MTGSQTSADQPDPISVLHASTSCFLKLAKLPKSRAMSWASSPVGSPPAPGARFCQKMLCRTWPLTLKASFCSRAAIDAKSDFLRAARSFSMISFAVSTYLR